MKAKNIYQSFLTVLLFMLSACTKDALDKKSDIHLSVATTLDDFQQLMDGLQSGRVGNSNSPGLLSYRSLGDFLSDDLNLTDQNYDNYYQSSPYITALYKWDKDMFSSLKKLDEYDVQYQIILNSNVVLDGLSALKVSAAEQAAYNNVKGSALFVRGQMFYNLAQFWAKPYQSASAASDIGIVLRLSSDPNVVSVRSNVADTYKQVIADLTEAADLLPDISAQNTQLSKIRPSKAAAYGVLARAYLATGDYANVIKYADAALKLYSSLLDFSELGINKFYEVPDFHKEIMYYSFDARGSVGQTFGPWNVNTALYNLYDSNDLRKQYFFNNTFFFGFVFSGDFSGADGRYFTGIGVDELYLMRAEGYARTNNITAAMADLNTLLANRYKAGTFVPFTASSADEVLVKVISERRKELSGRGLRWTDLRRLNLEPEFAVTISRSLHGETFTLPPNDSRYTLQIPPYVIAASNGSIKQTP